MRKKKDELLLDGCSNSLQQAFKKTTDLQVVEAFIFTYIVLPVKVHLPMCQCKIWLSVYILPVTVFVYLQMIWFSNLCLVTLMITYDMVHPVKSGLQRILIARKIFSCGLLLKLIEIY